MPKRDPDPLDVTRGPSRGSICPDCGYEWAAVTTSATAKRDVAKHSVRHAKWDLDGGRRPVWTTNAVAAAVWLVDRLNARITDLEVERASLAYDLDVATKRGDDYEAELTALEEGRHA